jgi:hypothetical protein
MSQISTSNLSKNEHVLDAPILPVSVDAPILPVSPNESTLLIKCNRQGCKFLRHTNIENNGGTHCCYACKTRNKHGAACQRNIYMLLSHAVNESAKVPRLLIYKGSGGLAHNINGLMAAISICENQKRTLIVDMGMHNAFKMPFSKVFSTHNLTIPCFEPNNLNIEQKHVLYKGISLNDIFNNSTKFNKGTYTISNRVLSNLNINNNENIAVLCVATRSNKTYPIYVNNNIINMLNEEEIINEKYISIHYRNTDKKNNINKFILCIKKIIKETNINTLYLASDYSEAYNIILDSIPTLKIIRKTIPLKNIKNLHYSSENKFQELYECIRDIYYICKSTYFIPSVNSGLSNMIIYRIIKNKNHNFMFRDLISKTHIVVP